MKHLNNAELAYIETDLLCKHSQSKTACMAVIKLFQTKDIDVIKKILKDDEQLLSICDGPKRSNVEFLPQWVRHYFASCIYAFNDWPKINFVKSPILIRIYDICHSHFHDSVVPVSTISLE